MSGSQRCFCASLPNARIERATSEFETETTDAITQSTRASSSQMIPYEIEVRVRAAELLGDHRTHQAELGQLRDQLERVAALALVALDVRQDLLLRELAHRAAHLALLVAQVEVSHAVEGSLHEALSYVRK